MARHRFAIRTCATGLDLVEFGSKAAARRFEQATDQFFFDGHRTVLYEALLALGMDARTIRWHADHPGERMLCLVTRRPPQGSGRPAHRTVRVARETL